MSLPEQIAVQYTEESAGYMSVRTVEKQTFRLHDLADLVVSATGKDAGQVQRILLSGSLLYNGYKYWWSGFSAQANEIEALLSSFPEDDSNRAFDPQAVTAVLFEMAGGAQRHVTEITKVEASKKKIFGSQSPWDVLIQAAAELSPRYEKYSHAHKADLFRASLPYEKSKALLTAILDHAPSSLRRRWTSLHSPAAMTFVCPR
jgi:hypothetical protein